LDQAKSAALGTVTKYGTTNSYLNGFAIAQEMEVNNTRNDVILQGVNAIDQNIFFGCNVILVFENGVMQMNA